MDEIKNAEQIASLLRDHMDYEGIELDFDACLMAVEFVLEEAGSMLDWHNTVREG